MRKVIVQTDREPVSDCPTIPEISLTCSDDETTFEMATVFYYLMIAMGYSPQGTCEAFEWVNQEFGKKGD